MVALLQFLGISLWLLLQLIQCQVSWGFASRKVAARPFVISKDCPRPSALTTKFSPTLVPIGLRMSQYTRPEDEEIARATSTKNPPLYPKAGDLVRYYDLDGGKSKGQVLVGRIRFIQQNIGGEGSGWSVELTEMEDVGQGYYADYGSRQRWSKGSTYRDLLAVSPLSASFVRTEDAYKVPTSSDGRLLVRREQYDVEGYKGPFSDSNVINKSVLEADAIVYEALKSKLLKYAAIAGAVGTVIADLTKGTELAVIYFAGFASSLLYLVFLSLKTDTIGTEQASFGKNVSNLRFLLPVLVIVGVAFYNQIQGASVATNGNLFQTVTSQQFGAATIGFLTYRLPLFFSQIEGAFKGEDGKTILPGSAGVAMQLMKRSDGEMTSDSVGTVLPSVATTTVFLISGPQATGRTDLVKRLLESGDDRFITPTMVDITKDGAKFERLEQRGEFLATKDGRFGLTKQAILDAGVKAVSGDGPPKVLVVDASVELAKKLMNISQLRLVGVWIGLSSVASFEKRLGDLVDSGALQIAEDETRESSIRNKIREIVKEIEFGISSGIFEFTILNDEDTDKSLKQLLEASNYVN